jgi:hypothetical protein
MNRMHCGGSLKIFPSDLALRGFVYQNYGSGSSLDIAKPADKKIFIKRRKYIL